MLSNPSFQCKKVVRAGNIVVLNEKNPHIRNTRDGTVIKGETGPVFSWQGKRVVKPLSTSFSSWQHCAEVKQQTRKRWNEMKRQN